MDYPDAYKGRWFMSPTFPKFLLLLPKLLSKQGLLALVISPLMIENKVFGVLIISRFNPDSFSSTDCEFLRQLSEQSALAVHQANLYNELQRAYNDLRISQQSAMQQDRLRALGQMASGIAHDLNNAIAPVLIYTESLLEKELNLSPRARNYLQTISHAIEDVAATIARMREFYRNRESMVLTLPVQLNNSIEQVIELTRVRWNDMPQERGIVIKMITDLSHNLPLILGVEGEVREALTNLFFNAIDAMPHGGSICIKTNVVGTDFIQLDIIDNGLGMDETTLKRCIEPFYTTKGERGTGLGLAMVYGVMQRHKRLNYY